MQFLLHHNVLIYAFFNETKFTSVIIEDFNNLDMRLLQIAVN